MNSILLHLEGGHPASRVIEVGVQLARRRAARVRGITVLDTRRIEALTACCETAAQAVGEQSRLRRAERRQLAARARLSQACLSAGLNFYARGLIGDPVGLLKSESQFHDLVIMGYPEESDAVEVQAGGLLPAELLELLDHGVQPLLVVRGKRPVERVLMAYDGSLATGRAIRSFLQQDLFSNADHRLLAIGTTEAHARLLSREIADYCVRQRPGLETGCMAGTLRRVLLPYADKWQADMIVLGAQESAGVIDRLRGAIVCKVLNHTRCTLYTCN